MSILNYIFIEKKNNKLLIMHKFWREIGFGLRVPEIEEKRKRRKEGLIIINLLWKSNIIYKQTLYMSVTGRSTPIFLIVNVFLSRRNKTRSCIMYWTKRINGYPSGLMSLRWPLIYPQILLLLEN